MAFPFFTIHTSNYMLVFWCCFGERAKNKYVRRKIYVNRNLDHHICPDCCGTYHNHKDECTPHTIKALHLRQLALATIQEVCAQVREDREEFAARILDRKSEQAKKELAANHKALAQAKKRLDELSELLAKAFEKMEAGILTDEQFQQLSKRYSTEQREFEACIPQLEVELEEQEANIQGVNQFLNIVDRYLDVQELTPEILHEFVARIRSTRAFRTVEEKNYTQKVDICFNYIGNLE